MMIYSLPSGDEVFRYEKSIVVKFIDNRKVLSTAHINGGYREDLESVFNFDSNQENGIDYCTNATTYERDLKTVARILGLNPDKTVGITTAVSMDNVSIKSAKYEDLTVTAIVTGGIEGNAGRVGDPAFFHERKGENVIIERGTINIILVIDGNLTPGAMARCVVTSSEAKTAALQELMADSMYSRGLATGSGTDETIIICNSGVKNQLKFAGKHSKLGELIGKKVMEAVKEGLDFQTRLNPVSQHNILRRMRRFGMNEDNLLNRYITNRNNDITKDQFLSQLDIIQERSSLVTLTSLYAHLIDQLDWKLLSMREVQREGLNIINKLKEEFQIKKNFDINMETIDNTIKSMVDNYMDLVIEIISRS